MIQELYKVLARFIELEDKLEEEGESLELEKDINQFVREVALRTDNFVELYNTLKANLENEKKEVQIRQARVKRTERYMDKLKEISEQMLREGIPLNGKYHSVKLVKRTVPSWDNVNIDDIPDDYIVTTKRIDKTRLLKAIKEGIVEGNIEEKQTEYIKIK